MKYVDEFRDPALARKLLSAPGGLDLARGVLADERFRATDLGAALIDELRAEAAANPADATVIANDIANLISQAQAESAITINGIDTEADIRGPESLLTLLRDELALPIGMKSTISCEELLTIRTLKHKGKPLFWR